MNCVMRESSPIYVLQDNTHASSTCALTWDCMNTVEVSGLMPQAISSAIVSMALRLKSSGSCRTVMACRSTTQ